MGQSVFFLLSLGIGVGIGAVLMWARLNERLFRLRVELANRTAQCAALDKEIEDREDEIEVMRRSVVCHICETEPAVMRCNGIGVCFVCSLHVDDVSATAIEA